MPRKNTALTPVVVEHQGVPVRAEQVRQRLVEIEGNLETGLFDICDLLLEAKDNNYHTHWGYVRFGDWIEEASGLRISARTAYYYITIATKVKELGLSREQISAVGISKLKEIFTLEPEEHANHMKELVEAAPDSSLDDVSEAVAKVRGKEPAKYMTLKLDPEVKETVKEAFELARRVHGSTVRHGEVVDITDSRCMELICASFLQDPNNYAEPDKDEDVEEIPTGEVPF
jgi:hypothetical protein